MKISRTVRTEHARQLELNRLVKDRVSTTLTQHLDEAWHFESRLKSLESYALKVETGRFAPDELEDFFACTIVVPTLARMRDAELLIDRLFDVVGRKPKSDAVAISNANEFPFDHTRIYARLRPPIGLDAQPLHKVKFEVQVKTYLQHAWSIATHDLTYKATELSWGKERVAAQVKATLEAAEVAILEAEVLASSGNRILAREDPLTTELVLVIKVLQREFQDNLPADMKRLAQSVRATMVACQMDVGELNTLLLSGKANRGGFHSSNLSPFGTVLQYILEFHPDKLRLALTNPKGVKIFVPEEIAMPLEWLSQELPQAVRLDSSRVISPRDGGS